MGKIEGKGPQVGGIVGKTQSGANEISYCYNNGLVSGTQIVGGIAGILEYTNGKSSIKNCYNLANINGETYIGSIVGENKYSSPNVNDISDCIYLSRTAMYGIGKNGTDIGSNDGCVEYSNIDNIISTIILLDAYEADVYILNNSYPILKWQIPYETTE